MFPLSLHNYFEIAALVTSVIIAMYYKHPIVRWLLLYLLFIVVVELTGRYMGRVLREPNYTLYNISVPVEYLFYTFLFYKSYRSALFKKMAGWFLVLFPLFALVNLFFIQGTGMFNTNFLKVGSFFMIIFCCLYLYELLIQDSNVNPFKDPMFWITTGVLIFNAGEFVSNSLSHILFNNWKDWMITFNKINHALIYVLYSCIIIALISFRWTTKRT